MNPGLLILVAAASAVLYASAAAADVKLHPLAPVPNQSVTIDDGFWSPKIAVWRKTTINDSFDKFEKTGALNNFDRVAARQNGGHLGDPWWDGLVYEMITASADFLASHPDAALEKRVDGYIERIAAAAAIDPDGFVNTDVTLDHVGVRWSSPPAPGDKHNDVWPHTLYNAGSLVEAGVHYYRATGKTRLLRVATKMANYMTRIMGAPPRQNIVPGHAIAEQAFVGLFQLYRDHPELKQKIDEPVDEKEYLKLAEFWIENRGNHAGRENTGVYNQDDQSVFRQPSLEGHAVRAALLASSLATAAVENKRPEYLQTADRWWQNMAEAKMYVTGGLGAIPSFEGFGADYELPNNGYAETCAAVAGSFFSQNLNLATGQAKYVDVLEREFYNGALSGVSLSGDRYFYTNKLAGGPNNRRLEWHGIPGSTPCCPPMFLKLMGALPGYLYATDANGVYVNLYAGSTAQIHAGALRLTLRQTTNYPWDGDIKLAVSPLKPSRFSVNLRIPGWSHGAWIAVNGHAVPSLPTVNGYAHLERTWKTGDIVTLHLPMPVTRVKADPRVAADVGRVALMRGPVVYCLEEIDNPARPQSLVIPPTASITAEHRPNILGGVTVLHGDAQIARRQGEVTRTETAKFTAIPFYANSNREPTEMEVWIADDAAHAQPLSLAGEAVPSASHCNPGDTVAALNDAVEPKSSDDDSIPRMTWWDHRGTAEWVQYDFKSPRRISGVALYWWDERRVGRQCRIPQSWKVLYRDHGQWKPVPDASAYGTQVDTFNQVTFHPVTTDALRVAVQLQPDWSGGILEWRVLDEGH